MLRLLAVFALIAVAVFGIYHFGYDAPQSQQTQAPHAAVEVTRVARHTMADVREFPGNLEASAQLTVAPKIGGRIDTVAVDIGDRVNVGDMLITLDDEEYRQALAEAEARLRVARAQLEQAESDARTANQTLARVRSLNEKGIAATAELDAAEAEAANTNAARSVARATIAEASAQLESARVRLDYTRIKAGWSGAAHTRMVGERMAEPGDTVAANTPLLRIVSVTPLTAVIRVPEQIYTRLTVGQSARLRVAGAADAQHDATIARIAPVFNPQTRRAQVELSVPNDDRRLAPGMFVQVGLVAERLEDAPVVPRAALVERGGEQGVFMVDGDAARFTPVDVAFTNGDNAAIQRPADLSGLVVTLGQAQLEDGISVSFDAPAARAAANEMPADDAS